MPWVPFEVRPVPPTDDDRALGQVRTWLRCPSLPPVAEQPTLHRALLVHSSELFPFGGLGAVVGPAALDLAVLTHSLTIHDVIDLSQWHVVIASVREVGRGFTTSQTSTYTADGRLVLTVEQFALTRPRR